jgi:hypothetical protein
VALYARGGEEQDIYQWALMSGLKTETDTSRGLAEGLTASSVPWMWVGPPSDVRDFSALLTRENLSVDSE